MNFHLVIVIDFLNKNTSHSQYNNSEQKILSFCSMLIELLLKNNLNLKIAIIVNRGEITEQICHFSNNIFHHIQGLKRILKASVYGKKNIKSCILLAIRLINFTNQIKNSEILLISSKCDADISIHFMGANLIKNKIKFSTIEFEKKSFIYEMVSKLTGGFYINYSLQKKNEIFFLIKNKICKNIPKFNDNYLSICIKRTRCFCVHPRKKDNFVVKILNYCPVCRTTGISSKFCINCRTIFLSNIFYKKLKFDHIYLSFSEKFSIFNYEYNLNLMIFLNNTYKK